MKQQHKGGRPMDTATLILIIVAAMLLVIYWQAVLDFLDP